MPVRARTTLFDSDAPRLQRARTTPAEVQVLTLWDLRRYQIRIDSWILRPMHDLHNAMHDRVVSSICMNIDQARCMMYEMLEEGYDIADIPDNASTSSVATSMGNPHIYPIGFVYGSDNDDSEWSSNRSDATSRDLGRSVNSDHSLALALCAFHY